MKRKALWLFLAKLALFTGVLGWIWFAGLQVRYPDLLDPVATPLFTTLGVRRWWLALVLQHFTSIVPYLALVLATPNIRSQWKRFTVALVGGTAAIVLGHLLLSVAVYYLERSYGFGTTFYRFIVPLYLLNDALPLVLWLAFFPNVPGLLLGRPLFRSRPTAN